jgi:hypothetical protein
LATRYDGRASWLPLPNPVAGWVFAGEGKATRKWDGVCVRVIGGQIQKMLRVLPGQEDPPMFYDVSEVPDGIKGAGMRIGWVPLAPEPEDYWYRSSFKGWGKPGPIPDGFYEVIGPNVKMNPEGQDSHKLVPHGADILHDVPHWLALRDYLAAHDIEGIVWHHPDGRMAQVSQGDFGLIRKRQAVMA